MKRSSKAIFPGSFDPLTRGHVDIANRALAIFDEVHIAVLSNIYKETVFSAEERVRLIKEQFAGCAGLKVGTFSGLLVEYAREIGANVIIRGLRATSDYDYEAQMALMNKNLWDEIETFFLIAREEHSYVSSSLAKQIAAFGGSVAKLVTPSVEKALLDKFKAGGANRPGD